MSGVERVVRRRDALKRMASLGFLGGGALLLGKCSSPTAAYSSYSGYSNYSAYPDANDYAKYCNNSGQEYTVYGSTYCNYYNQV